MPALKGVNGIGKTLSTLSASPERHSLTAKAATLGSVFGVVLRSLRKALKNCFAQPIAKKNARATSEVCSVRFTRTMRPVFNLTVDGEHCYYANGVLTHNCDTVSQALRHLRELGVLSRSAERMADIDEQMRHRGAPPEPLYPV